jgi:hypothetical protein
VLRLDIPDKAFGLPRFVHDLELPGMLHGRVLRPPSPAAVLLSLDDSKACALEGIVAVVRDGSFVGVLAEREEVAVKALERLRAGAAWTEPETLPDASALADWLRSQPVETKVVDERTADAVPPATRTLRARYSRPYLAHASIGPSRAGAGAAMPPSGATARAYTTSVPISRRARPRCRADRRRTRRGRGLLRPQRRRRCRAGRGTLARAGGGRPSGSSGRAQTSSRGRRSAPRWRSS